MTEIEKLQAGEYYRMDDAEIAKIHHNAVELFQKFNTTPITDFAQRESLLQHLFGSVGKNPSVKPGFFCDLGINIHVGDDFLTNYNVTILDMAPVTIGDNVWIGPNVGIYAVAHPMEAAGRKKIGLVDADIKDCMMLRAVQTKNADELASENLNLSANEATLDFAYNASLAAINIVKLMRKETNTPLSIRRIKSLMVNAHFLKRFFCVCGIVPKSNLNTKLVKELFGHEAAVA